VDLVDPRGPSGRVWIEEVLVSTDGQCTIITEVKNKYAVCGSGSESSKKEVATMQLKLEDVRQRFQGRRYAKIDLVPGMLRPPAAPL
jgi:hypothetical protein